MPERNSMRILGGSELLFLRGVLEGRGAAEFFQEAFVLQTAQQLPPNQWAALRSDFIRKGGKADDFEAKVPQPSPKPKIIVNNEGTKPKPKTSPEIETLEQLQTMTFPPLKYTVPGLIVEGCVLLAREAEGSKILACSRHRYCGRIRPMLPR